MVCGAIIVLAATPAMGQTAAADADFRGSATGAVVHVEGIEQPELSDPTSFRLVDADLAFSAAAVDSAGLPDRQTTEFGGTFQPPSTANAIAVAGQNAYGRGFGLDVSVGQEGQQQGQLTLAGLAEAVAPPSTDLEVNELGPVPGDPLAYAALVHGESRALYDATLGACPSLGSDLAYGMGMTTDAQLVDQDGAPDAEGESPQLEQPTVALLAESPQRAVSSSVSRTFLAEQTSADGTIVGDGLALVSETRQTIAPVTLFRGTPNELTVEVLGEWVLRAVATGVAGEARIHYGPEAASPETPLVRIIQAGSVDTILTTQDVFGDEGLVIDALPIVSIAIGEAPHAIGTSGAPEAAADGTSASAAVDVVRIRVLSQVGTGEAAEIRIGHMEVTAAVPAGGLDCRTPLPAPEVAVTEVAPGPLPTTGGGAVALLGVGMLAMAGLARRRR